MVDMTVLEAVAARCRSSSLLLGTSRIRAFFFRKEGFLFVKNLYNTPMQSIFESSITPLASLLRPEGLDDLVGQQHLIGEGRAIRKFIEAGRLPSILLW
jgi:hypothetical protein